MSGRKGGIRRQIMIITTIREKMTLFCRILPNESVSRIFDPPPPHTSQFWGHRDYSWIRDTTGVLRISYIMLWIKLGSVMYKENALYSLQLFSVL